MIGPIRAVTDDGRPRTVAFRFDAPLEDASLAFVQVDGEGELVPLALPTLGDSLTLAPVYP